MKIIIEQIELKEIQDIFINLLKKRSYLFTNGFNQMEEENFRKDILDEMQRLTKDSD